MIRRLALVVLLLAIPTAIAHATPATTDPANGERLAESPTRIRATFTEPLDPAATTIALLGGNGTPVALGEIAIDGDKLTIPLAEPLPEGGYLLRWETISAADGHKTSGSWSFVVGEGTLLETEDPSSPSFRADAVASKATMYAGLALLSAAPLMAIYVHPASAPSMRPYALSGAFLALGGTGAFFASQLGASGLAPSAYLATAFGRGVALRLFLALLLVALALRWRGGRAEGLALAGVSLASVAIASAYSHASALVVTKWIGTAIHTAHYGATLAWAAGVALLWLHLRRLPRDGTGASEAFEASVRFGKLATALVAIASVSGAALYLGLLGTSWQTWLASPYGGTLGAHTAIGLAMIGFGGLHRFVHVPRLRSRSQADAFGAFRSSVFTETAIAAVVLLLAAAVTNLQPATEPAAPEPPPPAPGRSFQLLNNTYLVHLTVAPGAQAGSVSNISAHILDRGPNTAVEDAYRVTLSIRDVTRDASFDPIQLANLGDGIYATEGSFFPFEGRYNLTLAVQTPRVVIERFSAEVDALAHQP